MSWIPGTWEAMLECGLQLDGSKTLGIRVWWLKRFVKDSESPKPIESNPARHCTTRTEYRPCITLCIVFFLFFNAVVKLWYTNMEHSVASLEAKANVCCVKFNPESRYHLAFGSAGKILLACHKLRLEVPTVTAVCPHHFMLMLAHSYALLLSTPTDHCVHYFDLRNTKQALNVFKGHRKAVSYAKFVGPNEIVSALVF